MEEDCTVTLEFKAVDGLRVGLTNIHHRIIGFHFSFKVIEKLCMAAIKEAVKECMLSWREEILCISMR